MRYVTFLFEEQEYAGILNEDGQIFSFQDLIGGNAPQTMLDFIRYQAQNPQKDWASLLETTTITPLPLDRVKLLSPIPYPLRNVICIGKNYADHVMELQKTGVDNKNSNIGLPEHPAFFSKMSFPTIGNGMTIPAHEEATALVDYEVELAVIIGRKCHRIQKETAHKYIFGYTIMNDITARDLQHKHNQWFLGKSLDGYTSLGPWITGCEDIHYPPELTLETRINGEIRQKSNTRNMIFSIGAILETLSQGCTLYPGDIIATGTPSGIGYSFDPPKMLKTGDLIECSIEKIGTLRNIMG